MLVFSWVCTHPEWFEDVEDRKQLLFAPNSIVTIMKKSDDNFGTDELAIMEAAINKESVSGKMCNYDEVLEWSRRIGLSDWLTIDFKLKFGK